MPSEVTERLVIDASLALAWYFADEANVYADEVARGLATREVVVPSPWRLELANTLIVGERRERSTEAQAAGFLAHLATLPIVIDDETDVRAWSETMSLTRARNPSAYDAAYLELAMRRGFPIASLDDRLKAAATAAGPPRRVD